jgi:hypothetical protein
MIRWIDNIAANVASDRYRSTLLGVGPAILSWMLPLAAAGAETTGFRKTRPQTASQCCRHELGDTCSIR